MAKRKICIIPYETFETDAIEAWLEDMAGRGWRLEKMTLCFASFRQAEPAEVRYRFDVLTCEKNMQEEKLNTYYAACGWQRVTDFSGHDFAVFCAEDASAEELHTDPAVFRQALRKVGTDAVVQVVLCALAMAFSLLGIFGILKNPLYLFIGHDLYGLLGYALILLAACVRLGMLCPALRRYRTWERTGETPPGRRIGIHVVWFLVFFVFALPGIFGVAKWSHAGRNQEFLALEDYPQPLPCPLWQDIDAEEHLEAGIPKVSEAAFPPDQFAAEDWIMCDETPFAPRIFMLRQKAALRETADGSFVRDDYYDADVYEMRSETYAGIVAQKLTEDIWYGRSDLLDTLDFDSAAYYQAPSGVQSLVLRRGTLVVQVGYSGARDLRDVLSLFSERLACWETTES